MIDEKVKVHDKFSVELKLSFITQPKKKRNDFALNIWMFVPNSLDINRYTYTKSEFYRDMKSNIRLITPVFKLTELIDADKSPYISLQKSLQKFAENPNSTNQQDYEYHVKMFMSILKSSLREEVRAIKKKPKSEINSIIDDFVAHIIELSMKYRNLFSILEVPLVEKNQREYFLFGDEYMSNIVEFQSFRLMQYLKSKKNQNYEHAKPGLLKIISAEISYRTEMGYLLVEKEKGSGNNELVNRLSLLKKYIESHLYLGIDKRKDGVMLEQLLFSIAAGISMIFATAIAFSIQQKYGSFTMPLFVALVISYMLKDRIKEFTRYYFASKMGSHYFDHKAKMYINQTNIGWVKESWDFISSKKLPSEIVEARNCTSLIEANNRGNSEKVMLYKMQMRINQNKLNTNNEFVTSGVNSILRFNFSEIIRNMDNPEFMLYYPNDEKGMETIEAEKLYYLNFIIEKKNDVQNERKRYRLALNRNGIQRIQSL